MLSNDKSIENIFRTIFRFRKRILFLAFLLTIGTTVYGQIIDCSETHPVGVFQIYLDELYYTTAAISSDQDLQNLMRGLVFKLSTVMEGIMQEVGVIAPCVISYCEGRKPRDMTDFTRALVERLHREDVILEVWGSLDTKTNASGETFHEARIYYLLVPIWIEAVGKLIQPGLQFEEYISGSSTNANRPLDLLQEAPEMRVFVKICVGKNLLLNKKYDDARKLLCAAKWQLESYISSNSSGETSSREKALIEYVDRLARQAASLAQADPNYNGALKLISDDDECPCLNGGID